MATFAAARQYLLRGGRSLRTSSVLLRPVASVSASTLSSPAFGSERQQQQNYRHLLAGLLAGAAVYTGSTQQPQSAQCCGIAGVVAKKNHDAR